MRASEASVEEVTEGVSAVPTTGQDFMERSGRKMQPGATPSYPVFLLSLTFGALAEK